MSSYAPFRYVVLWTLALMLVSGMVSSSARAVTLGNAAALSALGQPLRVAISLATTEEDAIAADCFGLVQPAGDGPPGIVTGRVSLERGAAGQRLIVTTTQPIGEPALRLSVETRCGSPARRDYMLLLDPSAAVNAPTPAAAQLPTGSHLMAEADAPPAREPRQERPPAATALTNAFGKKTAAARREPPESSGTGVARIAQRPVGVDVQIAPAVFHYASTDPALSGGSLRHVAAVGDAVRIPSPRTEPEIDRSKDMWWTIAVAVAGFAVIVLGAIVVRHGRGAPRASSSIGATRGTTHTGPRSSTDLSAAPVMLSRANIPTDALLTRAAPTTRSWVSPATAVTLPNLSTASKPGTASTDSSSSGPPEETLDTLFNAIDSDLSVETAIRKVHAAAARGSPEYDIGCDAILKAIEAAERDLMLAPLAPSDTAMGHALEDELLVKPKRKAA